MAGGERVDGAVPGDGILWTANNANDTNNANNANDTNDANNTDNTNNANNTDR